MKLNGRICYLVPFDEEHMNSRDYLGWLRDYEVMKTINRLDYLRPVSVAEVREYCTAVMRSSSDVFLAIYFASEDRFVGTLRVKVNWHTRVADVGIMVGDRACWGRGIATEAIRLVGHYLFDTLSMRKLTAGLMGINPAMLKAFEGAGFRHEGVFRGQDYFEGRYVDHIYLGCFKEELVDTEPAAKRGTE